jgi:myo-inositol-1(or 4)-monophosphatase
MNTFVRTAKLAASRAGKILLDGFRKHHRLTYKLPRHQSIVTAMDRAAEKAIRATIRATHPDHAILGEEAGMDHRASEYLWVIDPLDGTSNYVSGVPLFNVAIALQKDGETILGCVYQPVTDELFLSIRGRGAWRNGKRVVVSPQTSFAKSYGFIEWTNENAAMNAMGLDIVSALRKECIRVRNIGSSALVMSYIGSGSGEYMISIATRLWDVAAAALMVIEAGGRVTDFSGKDAMRRWKTDPFAQCALLASNGKVHAPLSRLVRTALL